MMGSLRGVLLDKKPGHVLVDVQGIGYEVMTPVSAFDRIPGMGNEAQFYVVESMAMYGGGVTLYGFMSLEEKEIFLLLREIPGTGSKKALDYLDKITKSAPDFRRAILEGDTRALTGLFGFTKKTSEKMVVALKDRLAALRLAGKEKWSAPLQSAGLTEALAALLQLGYRESEARSALDQVPAPIRSTAAVSDLIREALKQLA